MATAPLLSELLHPTDECLFTNYRAGSERAFEQLFARYETRLIGFIRRQTSVRRDVAEEIAQETWLRVHRAQTSFDPARCFRAWLFTIAKKRSAEYFRRKRIKARPLTTSAGETIEIPTDEPPDARIISEENCKIIHRAIDGLRERERVTARKICLGGRPLRETADELGLSLWAIERTIRQVYRRLRFILRPAS
jgi:RNA polymerase sigma-70 factor, ECF subfamily